MSEKSSISSYRQSETDSLGYGGLCRRIFPSGFKDESKSLIVISIPIILTNMFAYLILTESVILCGHLTTYELGAAGLANSFINAFGLAVALGLTTACDTYFSQIFGSEHKKKLGMILQRSLLIMTITPFFLIPIFINSEPLFVLLGQDIRISELTSRYVTLFSPGLLFSFYYLTLARYMQNQDYVYPPMIICMIGNLFNVVSQYVAIYELEWGFDASAVCQALTYFIMCILEVLYIYYSKMYKDTWGGWTRDAFLDWKGFLSLGIPGIAMIAMECFCWELGTFLAGILGPVALGVQSVLIQVAAVVWQVGFGISVAVNIRVGQSLGAMQPMRGLTSYRCGMTIMVFSGAFTGILLLSLRDILPKLFTDDADVIASSSQNLIILAFVQILDALNTVTLGALRGCGRQVLCTLFIFIAYYLLGQPVGISLAFLTDLGVSGLWIGFICSLLITMIFAVIVCNRQDWNHQAALAQARISAQTSTDNNYSDILQMDEHSKLLSSTKEIVESATHRRMPSQPRLSSQLSISISTQTELSRRQFKKIYMKRIFAFICAILVFLGGIFLRVYLPRESYLPANNTLTDYGSTTLPLVL